MSVLLDIAQYDGSLPVVMIAEWLDRHGLEGTLEKIEEYLAPLSTCDRAALFHDWARVWARPKQVIPPTGWEILGFLAGRGTGKTKALSHFVNDEVQAERAPLLCFIAQDEQSSIDLHVLGPSGVIATSKPWFRPEWIASSKQVVWPNGARAYVRTPEVPGKIRGLEYHLTWASELQSWPDATLDEAWMNVLLSTRLGLSRIVWDATAKRRHPLLTRLLKDGEHDPARSRVLRGSTYENAMNLGKGYIEKIERKYGGTRQGEEELFARMFEDAEGATAKQKWIEDRRRPKPAKFARCAIAVDVAVTARSGSDTTGIVVGGLGVDGQGYVLGDYSGKHSPGEWAGIVIKQYFAHGCDCLVIETNKGGDLVAQVLRAAASEQKIDVVVLGKTEKPRHVPGVLYIREVYARGEKADRAKPLSTAYEKGRVSHVQGAKLEELEELLTTWIPTPGRRSPDRLDATVHLMVELLALNDEEPDAKIGFVGLGDVADAIAQPVRTASARRNIATLIGWGGGNGGGRI